jgi:hypothetical protein
MLVYLFTENAQADIVGQVVFYEHQKEGLGKRFLEAVYQAAEEIAILPTG